MAATRLAGPKRYRGLCKREAAGSRLTSQQPIEAGPKSPRLLFGLALAALPGCCVAAESSAALQTNFAKGARQSRLSAATQPMAAVGGQKLAAAKRLSMPGWQPRRFSGAMVPWQLLAALRAASSAAVIGHQLACLGTAVQLSAATQTERRQNVFLDPLTPPPTVI